MPASVEILNIPIGSVLTSSIGANDEADKNDFTVLLLWGENVDLTQSGISVSAGSSIVAFEGANSVYMVRVRPPQTAGTVTVTVVANAVDQGNPQTSKSIRLSTTFPDADAETTTQVFTHGVTNSRGIAITPARIVVGSGPVFSGLILTKFTHAGIEQTSEASSSSSIDPPGGSRRIDVLNGDILVPGGRINETAPARYRETGDTLSRIETYSGLGSDSITHSRLGITAKTGTDEISAVPYGETTGVAYDVSGLPTYRMMAHQSDILYFAYRGLSTDLFGIAKITDDDTINFLTSLNISHSGFVDISIYRDTLYILSSTSVYTLDIKKYRPVAKRTKTTIYPVFVEEGGTIDLTQFSPDAERFTFDVGFKKPPYLSINASNELVVGSGAETVLVKLKAINRIDATETDSFGFYLIIRRATVSPVWRNVSELTMRAGSSYDLFQLVESGLQTPPTIAFRSGQTQPTGSRLSNGVFSIGTISGTAAFTARKGSRTAHIEIDIDVVQGVGDRSSLLQKNGVFRYRVEIAGIDVTSDLVGSPSVSETLDPVIINEYRVNDAAITLRNEGGKYNSALAGNFWETNGLNAGGFQNAVKIYTEHFDGNGNWIENLLFTGLILESFEPISEATFKMSCVDISSRLRKALAQDFGTLEKWDSLRKLSDDDSFEGTYIPERSLLPMQIGTGMARSDRTDLEISRLELPSEGPAEQNTAYMTPTELKTAGGFLDANPLLRFKVDHRSEDVRFLINQLATNKEIYNTEIDIPGVTVDKPFLLNRGSVAFSVGSPTRTTRLPVDWVVGVESGLQTPPTILILLSNPERHISDLLVQYDVQADSYRVLHTFDKDTAVHRIERRNSTNYYILTSAKIQQDRSAGGPLPRPNDSTGYASDSVSEGSEIKIYRYSTSSGTLTEHVSADDTLPPQLGIQYHVGFENSLYVDEFEGIRPDDRGAFKWNGSYLYYRYAKDGEFGVARVNTGGTTTKMIGQAVGKYQNHLNFAFDTNSSGSIYFVYATVGVPSDVTVVDNQPLGPGGSITIANNLSGNSTPFILRLETPGSNYGSTPRVTIVGINTSGESQSITTTFTRPGQTRELTQTFLDITSISASSGWVRGNLIVTAIFQDIESHLNIERRTNSGTTTTILENQQALPSLTDLDDTGGTYLGCHECVFHNNHLYILAQIGRVDVDGSEVSPSRTKAAGMVLYRCNVTAGSPSLTVIDTWDFVHQAGCNLIVHDGAVHFVEAPSAATRFKPYNPDLDTYNEEMGYNVLPEALGALKKINSSGEVEELGNVWYTDRPFNVFPTRMLSIDGDLHLCAGYGNLDELLRFNSLASQPDNIVHIVYGRTLHYVVPKFQPNGRSIYAALAGLAKSVNATLSFEKNVIMITDRHPFRAVTDGAMGSGTADIAFRDANKAFPSSGYLLIGKEILKYSGIRFTDPTLPYQEGMFTGITRGVLGSRIANPADDSEILYLDNIIKSKGLGSPYKRITLQSDTNRIYNIIRDSGGIAEVRDEDSIARYGERRYNLDLGLTRHEKAWIEQIFASYLEELKDLQQIVNIQVVPDFSLRLGHIVPFSYAGQLKAMRIVSIRYEKNTTHIKGRTVEVSATETAVSVATAPSQITGVTTANGIGQIVYTIPAPAANGSAMTKYQISADSSTWTDIPVEDGLLPNPYTYTLIGQTSGTAVTRYFRAVNAIGNGAASAAMTATPLPASFAVLTSNPYALIYREDIDKVYVMQGSVARRYSAYGVREASSDVSFSGTGTIRSGTWGDSMFWFKRFSNIYVRSYTANGQDSGKSFNFAAGLGNFRAMVFVDSGDSDTRYLYAPNTSGTVRVYSTTGVRDTTKEFSLSSFGEIDGAAYDPDEKLLYFGEGPNLRVTELDGTVVSNPALPSGVGAIEGLAFGQGHLWIFDNRDRRVYLMKAVVR